MPGPSLQRSALRSIPALLILGSTALAAPKVAPAPAPCANPGVLDGARRTLHDATATATALSFCTGEDCWSFDPASSTFTSLPTVKPASAPPTSTQGKSADGRATATATEVSFCPTPASCKKFTYKFEFEPQGGLSPMINAAGTLGAVIYAGVGEDHEPRYLLAYDLVAGKLIKQVELTANNADVFGSSFLFNNAFYSAKLKKLGKLALPKADLQPIAGTELVVMTDIDHGAVVVQDAATGKARPRIKLGGHLGIDQVVASPDGARLYVITQAASEGEVFAIDVAGNKVVAHAAPTRCAAGTARVR